ncbi:MAG: hypothetical protein JKY23_05040 [Nitrospinaceae bacterium]|nr:hypothetical protein [Nitrospinaceae bacterium]
MKKVKGSDTGLKISYDHKTMKNGIPRPATLIYDMSELLSKKSGDNVKLKLYSPYPQLVDSTGIKHIGRICMHYGLRKKLNLLSVSI